jgi:hypothetical protein
VVSVWRRARSGKFLHTEMFSGEIDSTFGAMGPADPTPTATGTTSW